MLPFVILVEFRLKPGAWARFEPLILDNAAASVRDEPGCSRFDVLTPREVASGEVDRVVLYEIYDDEAAFEAHKRTPHFARFDEGTRDLIADRALQRLSVRENPAR